MITMIECPVQQVSVGSYEVLVLCKKSLRFRAGWAFFGDVGGALSGTGLARHLCRWAEDLCCGGYACGTLWRRSIVVPDQWQTIRF